MKYCRNCISSKGICQACTSLKNLNDPNQWIDYLMGIQRSVSGENGQILGEILKTRNRLTLWVSSNKSYSVVVIKYSPAIWQILKKTQQFRIVITKSGGKVINILHE